jgi:hypothetical protein
MVTINLKLNGDMWEEIKSKINRMAKRVRDFNKTIKRLQEVKDSLEKKMSDERNFKRQMMRQYTARRRDWIELGQDTAMFYLTKESGQMKKTIKLSMQSSRDLSERVGIVTKQIRRMKERIKDIQRQMDNVLRKEEVVYRHEPYAGEIHMRVKYTTFVKKSEKILENSVDYMKQNGTWYRLGEIDISNKREADKQVSSRISKKLDKLSVEYAANSK